MTRSMIPGLTLALALALVACAPTADSPTTTSGAASTSQQSTTTSASPSPTTPPATSTTVEIVSPLPPPTGDVIASGEGWELTDEEFADLVDFAARTMQQSFPQPVGVAVLGTSGITDSTESGFEFLTVAQWDLMRALGLVTAEDSMAVVNEIRRQRLRGTCCVPEGDTLMVQVEDAGSEVLTNLVIVHELVHALLTQSPPQGVVPNQAFDEPVDVVGGAAEGVPQWVAMRYHASLSDADREAMAEELPIIRLADLDAGVPAAAAEVLAFGYLRGPTLVDGLYGAGVARPYDQVVDRFPATSEQILFPAAYVEAEIPVSVSPPVLPSGIIQSGSGRLGSLYLMLVAKTVVDEETALGLVRPWAGDSYVQWSDGAQGCVAVEIMMDDEAAAVALSEVMETWAAAQGSAGVEVTGSAISLSSCSG